MMNTTDLAARLCGDMVRAVVHRGIRSYIITHFHYPDGESLNLYLESKGEAVWVSDLGTTIYKCHVGGLELNDSRRQFIQSICNTYDLEMEKNILRKRLVDTTLGTDCMVFCEALSRISTLEYQREPRPRPYLAEQIDGLLKRKVEPKRAIERKWTNKLIDPQESFPVDYRLNGTGKPRHIFQVASADKSNLVSAVCNFFKAKDVYVPTLSIVDPDLELGEHHLDRLQLASTHIRFGVSGNEDAIVKFALEGMNVGGEQ